jgi:hypothetical protein
MSLSQFRVDRWDLLHRVNKIRANRCRAARHFRFNADFFKPEARPWVLGYWSRAVVRNRALGSHCGAEWIVRAIFPASAEDQALRVAGCESTGTPYHLYIYAKNPSSTASGLFQLLDTWWAGKFDPFNPWANTRAAYQLWAGSGGSFYRHWAASVGCWA